MKESRVFVGIDVGMDEHQVYIKNGSAESSHWTMTHRHSQFYELQGRLAELTGGQLQNVLVGLEGHSGNLSPLDQYLLQWGCEVVNLDARKLSLFRDMYGAPCKTDLKDAELIVHLLTQGDEFYKDGSAPYHSVVRQTANRRKLKKLTRYQNTLIEEKTRLINRLNKWIREISPELLDISPLRNATMLRMLKKYPNVRGLTQVTQRGLKSIDGIGSSTAEKFHDALQQLDYDSDMVVAYATMIEQTAQRLLELKQQIQQLDEQLKSIGKTIEEVQYLKSLPGCGVKLASRLMAEIADIDRFDSHNQLAAYLGIACVDHQSGNIDQARPIFPANSIGKDAMMTLANLMVRHDSESRKYYQKKRSEGNDHIDAVRRTARQIVKIIYRLLEEKREYVPYSNHSEDEERKKAA